MTVADIIIARDELADQIANQINNFEKETGIMFRGFACRSELDHDWMCERLEGLMIFSTSTRAPLGDVLCDSVFESLVQLEERVNLSIVKVGVFREFSDCNNPTVEYVQIDLALTAICDAAYLDLDAEGGAV